jgi:hypothetical protein
MQLYAGGNGIQSCRWKFRLAKDEERGAVNVIGVLLEVRAGVGRWDGAGEVLESELQRVGQDHPFVLTGRRMGKVGEALKLVAARFLLAGKEVVHDLVCPDGCASNKAAVSGVQDAESGCCGRCQISSGLYAGPFKNTEVRPTKRTPAARVESGCCRSGGADNVDVG